MREGGFGGIRSFVGFSMRVAASVEWGLGASPINKKVYNYIKIKFLA